MMLRAARKRGMGVAAAILLFGGGIARAAKREGPFTGKMDPKFVCHLNNFVIKLKKGGVPYVYKGQTYYFCCSGCTSRFAGNPDKLRMGKDPVDKQPIDKAKAVKYAVQDVVYYVQSGTNLDKFAQDPERYLKEEEEGKTKKEPPATGEGKVVPARDNTTAHPVKTAPATVKEY